MRFNMNVKTNFSITALGKLSVVNENHEPVEMSSLWAEKTGVLVFVRHFG